MSIKIYEYKKCTTCQKAIQFLDAKKINYERLAIVENPPTVDELKMMLQFIKADGGSFKTIQYLRSALPRNEYDREN